MILGSHPLDIGAILYVLQMLFGRYICRGLSIGSSMFGWIEFYLCVLPKVVQIRGVPGGRVVLEELMIDQFSFRIYFRTNPHMRHPFE